MNYPYLFGVGMGLMIGGSVIGLSGALDARRPFKAAIFAMFVGALVVLTVINGTNTP